MSGIKKNISFFAILLMDITHDDDMYLDTRRIIPKKQMLPFCLQFIPALPSVCQFTSTSVV